ncbi:MAG: hypothetical protein HY342_06035 [Candidatus Lambdaproteobacteria bacterium]|nr:hypothetical protein [Candidatus Lambdaproteobacteria bacterium]
MIRLIASGFLWGLAALAVVACAADSGSSDSPSSSGGDTTLLSALTFDGATYTFPASSTWASGCRICESPSNCSDRATMEITYSTIKETTLSYSGNTTCGVTPTGTTVTSFTVVVNAGTLATGGWSFYDSVTTAPTGLTLPPAASSWSATSSSGSLLTMALVDAGTPTLYLSDDKGPTIVVPAGAYNSWMSTFGLIKQ